FTYNFYHLRVCRSCRSHRKPVTQTNCYKCCHCNSRNSSPNELKFIVVRIVKGSTLFCRLVTERKPEEKCLSNKEYNSRYQQRHVKHLIITHPMLGSRFRKHLVHQCNMA